jgi:hypothetical protein
MNVRDARQSLLTLYMEATFEGVAGENDRHVLLELLIGSSFGHLDADEKKSYVL